MPLLALSVTASEVASELGLVEQPTDALWNSKPTIKVRGNKELLVGVSYSSIRELVQRDTERGYEVAMALTTLGYDDMKRYISLVFHVYETEEGSFKAKLVRGSTMPEKGDFSSKARVFFRDVEVPDSRGAVDERDEIDFFDSMLVALGVWVSRDEQTWSFRNSGRLSGR